MNKPDQEPSRGGVGGATNHPVRKPLGKPSHRPPDRE